MYYYIYCLTVPEFKNKIKTKGIFGSAVKLYNLQNFKAIISKIEPEKFNKNLSKIKADLEFAKETAHKHHAVINEVFIQNTVIPFKFFNVAKNEKGLKQSLLENTDNYQNIFQKIKNQEEWGIKLYFDASLHIKTENQKKEIQSFRREIKKSGEGKKWYLEKKLNEILKKSLDNKINSGVHEFENFLKDTFPMHTIFDSANPDDKPILSAAVLIRSENRNQMEKSLKRFFQNKKFINFKLTGPWPPYSFV